MPSSRERFHCNFGLAPGADAVLVERGLVVPGRDGEGAVRIIEVSDHPHFLASLFQPELAAAQAHPLIAAFVDAATNR